MSARMNLASLQPASYRAEVAKTLGAARALSRLRRRRQAQVLLPGFLPLPLRRWTACGSLPQLRAHGCDFALQAHAVASTCCTRWAGMPLASRPSSMPSRNGVHPRVTTDRNTANFRRQYTLIGTSYDWSREINSSRPGLLPLDAVVLLAAVPARAGIP